MAKRVFCVASSIAAAAVVYKADKIARLRKDERDRLSQCDDKALKIKRAIDQTRENIIKLKNEVGAPGIVVGVSVDGRVVWKEGIGFSDVENQVPAHEDTVMRIASISKSLTAAVVGRLWQEGIIDLDQPIRNYVPSFPEKIFGNEEVPITTKQLMCHLSGIRHYSKIRKVNSVGAGDGQLEEFYGMEKYENVEKALSIFKDDELLHPPGSKYLYSTYGWTLVSAVMEGATSKTYPQLMRNFLREMGMRRTYLDEHEPIIYGRSKYYGKNKNGKIINSPYVDNSCKWAGGGILSTVGDLLKFANAMLYAYQFGDFMDISKDKQVVRVVKGRKIKISQKVNDDKNSMDEIKIKESSKKLEEDSVDKKLKSANEDKTAKEGDNLNERISSMHSIKDSEVLSKIAKEESGSSSTIEDREKEAGRQVGTAVKYGGHEVADVGTSQSDKEANENEYRMSNVDRVIEVGSQAGKAVKYAGQAFADLGKYAWGKVWTTSEKQEDKKIGEDNVNTSQSDKEATQNENKMSNVDILKEVGSQAGTAVKYAGQAFTDLGKYAWGKVWTTSEKQEDKKIGEDNVNTSQSDKEATQNENKMSNVDILKEVGSQAGTAVKYAGQAFADLGKYAWGKVWTTSEKQEDKKIGEDNVNTSQSDKEATQNENKMSNVDILKEVGSQAGTAVKYAGQAFTDLGKYAWGKVWTTSEKQEDKKIGEDNVNTSQSDKEATQNENKMSNVDILKEVGSQAGTAVKYAGQAFTDVGKYAWGKVWTTSEKQEDKKIGKEDVSTSQSDKEATQNENKMSNVDILKEVGSQAGTAVKYAGQAFTDLGKYAWGKVWTTSEKQEDKKIGEDNVNTSQSDKEATQNENKMSNVDILKEVGSQAGTAVKYAGQAFADLGKYAWGKVWTTSEKQEDKKIGEDNVNTSQSDKEATQNENKMSNVDILKEVGSQAGTAVKYAGQAFTDLGKYAWGKVWTTSEKQEDKKIGEDNVNTSQSDKEATQNENKMSNVDILKEVGSQAGTAVKYAGQAFTDVGKYAWGKVWTTSEKQEDKKIGKEDVSTSQSDKEATQNENKMSNIDILKEVGSQAGTAAKDAGQAFTDLGKYAWGKVWSPESQTKIEDRSMEKQSESSVVKDSWNSIVGNVWKRISSDNEYKDKEINNNDDEESRSWSYFKNIFRPKALDFVSDQDFRHEFLANERKSFDEEPPRYEVNFQGMLMKKIIPYAVNVVLGLHAQNISDDGNEDYSRYLTKEDEIELLSPASCLHSHAAEQITPKSVKKPYISQKTVALLWTRVENTKFSDWGPYVEGGYGLGFGVAPSVDCPGGVDDGGQPFMVGHTGGAVGASSALIIMPRECGRDNPPKGVAVVIITNLQSVSLNPLAIEIARLFANATQ